MRHRVAPAHRWACRAGSLVGTAGGRRAVRRVDRSRLGRHRGLRGRGRSRLDDVAPRSLRRALDSPPGGGLNVPGMTIGQLAERSGLSVRTLRFYADASVLPEAARSESGYRPDSDRHARRARNRLHDARRATRRLQARARRPRARTQDPDAARDTSLTGLGPGPRDAHWRQIHRDAIDVYFRDPHAPWQRGTNENTNGLLRPYFPKGTDFSGVTEAALDAVANELNDRPRKRLGFYKPPRRSPTYSCDDRQNPPIDLRYPGLRLEPVLPGIGSSDPAGRRLASRRERWNLEWHAMTCEPAAAQHRDVVFRAQSIPEGRAWSSVATCRRPAASSTK